MKNITVIWMQVLFFSKKTSVQSKLVCHHISKYFSHITKNISLFCGFNEHKCILKWQLWNIYVNKNKSGGNHSATFMSTYLKTVSSVVEVSFYWCTELLYRTVKLLWGGEWQVWKQNRHRLNMRLSSIGSFVVGTIINSCMKWTLNQTLNS